MGIIFLGNVTFPVTPNPPSGDFYIGVDSADNRLKKQGPGSTVVDYESGATYTDENAQDAVGNALANTSSVDFIYNDISNTISAEAKAAGIDHNQLQNYQAARHVDHTAVQIQTGPGSGLAGGGDLSTTRALTVSINPLVEKQRLAYADETILYDSASGQIRKAKAFKAQVCNPDRYIFTTSDFIQSTLGDLTASQSGTGASAQAGVYGVDLTENCDGVLQIDTGTTATGRAAVGTASTNHIVLRANDRKMFGARLACEALSNPTETFFVYAGFLDNLGAGGDVTDGAYFRYTDALNGGRWEAVVAAAGVRQAVDTGVLVGINYSVFEVLLDFTGANQTAIFFIDGVQVAQLTAPGSPVPAGPAQAFGYGWKIEKTLGTGQRNLSADWYCYEAERTAGAR